MTLILCWQNVGKPAYTGRRQGRTEVDLIDVGGRVETLLDVGCPLAVRDAV